MKLILKNINNSAINIMRIAGYRFLRHDYNSGQMSFSKRIGAHNFPRFHAYVSERDGNIEINLHIDQKQQSYHGSNMHSGEYNGDILKEEINRIRNIINIRQQ